MQGDRPSFPGAPAERIFKPAFCALVSSCWSADASARPCANDVYQLLKDVGAAGGGPYVQSV
eukprot:COSAG01_NODE_1452_length_10260_cov_26.827970_18_plen_62_part_00